MTTDGPRRFHALLQRYEGTRVFTVPRDDWEALQGENPVPVDVRATPIAGVAHDAAVIASVAERHASDTCAGEYRVYRYDENDSPTPVNQDRYEVWRGLSPRLDVEQMVEACDTHATASEIRDYYRENMVIVRRPKGQDHWLRALPDSVAMRIEASDT